jgi:hypothetical protein
MFLYNVMPVGRDRQIEVAALLKPMCDKLRFQELERLKCSSHRLEFTGASVVEPSSHCTHLQSFKHYFFSCGALKAPELMDILICVILYHSNIAQKLWVFFF